MAKLYKEEIIPFFIDSAAHFRRNALSYRRMSQAAAFVAAIAILFNALFQLDAARNVDAVNLSDIPTPVFGVYYGSREVSTGETIKIKEVADILRESGFSQVTESVQNFASGSFLIAGNKLRFRSDFPEILPDITIEWQKDKISRIVSVGGNEFVSVKLPPKPITNLVPQLKDEDDAEYAVNFSVKSFSVRNNELDGSTVQKVLCAAEGRCDVPFSIRGTTRAAVNNFILNPLRKRQGEKEKPRQGGSTPMQELYKNVSGDRSDSYFRKLAETYAASDLANRMTPSTAFELWVNHIYFGVSKRGQNLYGVESAGIEIFDKNAKKLDLSESSFLAAIMPSPDLLTKLRKKNNDEAWKQVRAKQSDILDNVLRKNPESFTAAQIEIAKRKKIEFIWDKVKPKTVVLDSLNAPIRQLIAKEFSAFQNKQKVENLEIPFEELRSLRGMTAINEQLQRSAREILKRRLAEIQKNFPPVNEKTQKPAKDSLVGIIALMDNDTGNLVALVAVATDPNLEVSKLYIEHGVDPCSQFKPFTYSCALEENKLTLSSLINPQDGVIKQLNGNIWKPSRGVGDRPKTVAEGVGGSDDGVTVVAGNIVGIENTINFFGNATGNYAKPIISKTGEKEFAPVNILGFGEGLGTNISEFLESYSAFGRNGQKQKMRVLSDIYRGYVRTVQTDTSEKQIFSAETAYLMFWAMRGTVGVGAFGKYGTMANLPQGKSKIAPFPVYLQKHPEVQLGCKSGSGARNVGVTCVSPRFTVTSQLFYAKNSVFRQMGENDIYAAQTAGLIWSDFMYSALKIKPELFVGQISVPPGITEVRIDLARNCRSETGTLIPFKAGTEPEFCSVSTAETPTAQKVFVVDTRDDSGLNLRENKTLESFSVGFVPEGAKIEVLSCETEKSVIEGKTGNWCRARYGNAEGWAWGWYLIEKVE